MLLQHCYLCFNYKDAGLGSRDRVYKYVSYMRSNKPLWTICSIPPTEKEGGFIMGFHTGDPTVSGYLTLRDNSYSINRGGYAAHKLRELSIEGPPLEKQRNRYTVEELFNLFQPVFWKLKHMVWLYQVLTKEPPK